ncbi:MAG: molybdenum transporter, periplasmic molybdate-binding protein [Acidimicrobiales bacterium]|nr:molybdenum transporter, periplasmic molybdate-binding protein [Acidimicrobiales bacterium]
MRRAHHPALALLLAVGLLTGGCGSSGRSATTTSSSKTPAATPTGSITISAASSLKGAFTTLKAAFQRDHPGMKVAFNFGSSGTLEAQIENGAPADAAAFADTTTMDKLASQQLLAGPAKVFAKNLLIIVTRPGNPRRIRSLGDLSTAGIISLCGLKVPCGTYATRVLTSAGVKIPASKITRGQDVKATLAAVTNGDADAAIVYATDAKAAGSRVSAVAIPAARNVQASYPIAVVKASSHQATARAFVAYVLSPSGQAVLREAGFLAP